MDKYWYTYRCHRCGNPMALQLELIGKQHCPVCDRLEQERARDVAPIKVKAGEPVAVPVITVPPTRKELVEGIAQAALTKKPVSPVKEKLKRTRTCPKCGQMFPPQGFWKHDQTCKGTKHIKPAPSEREIREKNEQYKG